MPVSYLPRVYIGIVAYNSRHDLPACFAALGQQTYENYSVWVIDNASMDDSAQWVAENSKSRLIVNTTNVGYGRAHNQIIRLCALQPDEFYMTLNPDVILSPDYIALVVAQMQKVHAGWASGKLLMRDSLSPYLVYSAGHGLRRGGYAFNIGYGMPDDGRFDAEQEVFGVCGAAAIYSAGLVAALSSGGEFFDGDFFMYGEDVEVDWRARRLGWHCWIVPAAVAIHNCSHPDRLLRAQGRANRYLSAIKNAYGVDLWCYNLPLLALHTLLRLIVTPRQGILQARLIVRKAWKMFCKRQKPRLTRQEFHTWFRWSAKQPTYQPHALFTRLRAFIRERSSLK